MGFWQIMALILIFALLLLIYYLLKYLKHKKKLQADIIDLNNNLETTNQELAVAKNDNQEALEAVKSTIKSSFEKKLKLLERQNSELEIDLRNKSKELAKLGRDTKSNNQLLQQLRIAINEIEKNASTYNKARIKNLSNRLDEFLEIDDNIFEIQIDEIYQQFFLKLRTQYDELTTYDLRLCAYLKMGMKTKEIAEVLHVLPSSINVSRSRLRKKLGLDAGDDLYVFLNDFVPEENLGALNEI